MADKQQILDDVAALQTAATAATDKITELSDDAVSDAELENLHNALVSITDQLNTAVAGASG